MGVARDDGCWGWLLMVVGLVLSAASLQAATLMFSKPPVVREGRTYVPAREFYEWLGAGCQWLGDEHGIAVEWGGSVSRPINGAASARYNRPANGGRR